MKNKTSDWERAEQDVFDLLERAGWNPTFTKGSGRVHKDGDLTCDLFSVEVKSGRSIAVSKSRLDKVRRQAERNGLPPLLVFHTGGEIWAALPLKLLTEMLGGNHE